MLTLLRSGTPAVRQRFLNRCCSSSSSFSLAPHPSSVSAITTTFIHHQQLRYQSDSSSTTPGSGGSNNKSFIDADDEELEKELKAQAAQFASVTTTDASLSTTSASSTAAAMAAKLGKTTGDADGIEIDLKRVDRPPIKYEIGSRTGVYKWRTTAKFARRVVGPMREWADEFMCRTGVTVHMDPIDPDRASSGGYPSADEVEVDLFLFGGERAIHDCVPFLRAMIQTEPAYVRCGVFRRTSSSSSSSGDTTSDGAAAGEGDDGTATAAAAAAASPDSIEWLTLRRVNPEMRPVDIPPISLKTPGKYTLLFESPEEAVVRTIFEETGIEVDRKRLAKTHVFDKAPPAFFWRPRVEYWVAEVPRDAPVLGPQANTQRYVLHWDPRLLRQSADPIDRTWAAAADPQTGCAWLSGKVIDSLQAPVKLETNYMATRYTPAPDTTYADSIRFV